MGLVIILFITLAVALFTVVERKVLGGVQSSVGPNVVGVYGLLQPMADAFKLIFKEIIMPSVSNKYMYIISPMWVYVVSLVNWAVIPFNSNLVVINDIDYGVVYVLAISSLGVYSMILAGWASNSKYAFLGSLSSTAQMISYEISLGLIIMSIVCISGSLNFLTIVYFQSYYWNILFLFPLFMLFFVSILAETNSVPFDLPEAESELVSGYNVEYSSMTFALFFLAEYSNMILMSMLVVLFFLGGWYLFFFSSIFMFFFKVLFIIYMIMVISGILPSYSYDQLMDIGWKMFLPLILLLFFILVIFFWFFLNF